MGSKQESFKKSIKEKFNNHTSSFNDVKYININDIKLNPYQPRKEFNDESIKELSESIKEDGLLNSISITKDNVLIAGERRLRACKLLEFKEINCILIKDVDDAKLERLAIVENLQREDLNIFDEALAIKKLVDKSNIREVAKMIAKSKGYIQNRLYIPSLSDNDISYIKENNLKLKDMIEISKNGLLYFRSTKQNKNMNSHQNEEKKNEKKDNPKMDINKVTVGNKYHPNDIEKSLKNKYSNYGFEIFFDKDNLLIRVGKNKVDANVILKALIGNFNNTKEIL